MEFIEKEFLKSRKHILIRNMHTQMSTHKQFDWTLKKMFQKYVNEEAKAKAE